MITEEKLMAYADGELAGDDRASIETALPENERLQSALTQERLLRRKLSDVYDPALQEEVPERLTRLLSGGEDRMFSFGKRKSAGRPSWWQNVTALAATLVLGIIVGQSINGGGDLLNGREAQVADGELEQALDTQLASAQSPDAPVQVGISFVGPEGAPCRTFQSSAAAGLACRSKDRWNVMLIAPGSGSSDFEYQQAGSGPALVMKSAQELMVGEPMDAVEERRARDSGWGNAGSRGAED